MFANQIANQPPDISVSGNTIQLRWRRNAKQKRTLSYRAAQSNMRIIELENRCTGNRTVNPTLSDRAPLVAN